MNPAAMRNPLVDMPKSVNSICPQNVKHISIINDISVARFYYAVMLIVVEAFGHRQEHWHRAKRIGKSENDVRQMNANGSRLSIYDVIN